MPEKWTGVLIGKMHNARVSYDDLAAELGLTKGYLSLILNGKKSAGCEEALGRRG